ncbi:MAG: hypothetical protein DMG67_05840 [Acidobacteria bacterium]|nr:MAG: hypothetical protein DMG67_05840 [Acidobacteriota bacterium]
MSQLVRDFDLMAEQIEKLVSAQSRLLKDISHELRSPLARLTVALELARQRTGPEAESVLDRISLESDRMNELIGSLTTIARLESGAGTRKVPVQLEEIVEEIAQDADFEAQARNCQVQAEVMDELPVLGDPALLRSAIENVVRNATRYTPEGSMVKIHAETDPGFRKTLWRRYFALSTASMTLACVPPAGWGSGWPSPIRRSGCTAARSKHQTFQRVGYWLRSGFPCSHLQGRSGTCKRQRRSGKIRSCPDVCLLFVAHS